MAYFVIAGASNCPRYVMVEAVADSLQSQLPEFNVRKIVVEKDSWEKWICETCLINKWNHYRSPIIWRELVHRGSRGSLVGGINEFMEYASMYYGINVDFKSRDLMRIAHENHKEYVADKKREDDFKQRQLQHHVCVMFACHSNSAMLLFQAVKATFWAPEIALVIHLYCHPEHEALLMDMRDDIFDVGGPHVQQVLVELDLKLALKNCNLVLWYYDENADRSFETSSRVSEASLLDRDGALRRDDITSDFSLMSETLHIRRKSMMKFIAREPAYTQTILKIAQSTGYGESRRSSKEEPDQDKPQTKRRSWDSDQFDESKKSGLISVAHGSYTARFSPNKDIGSLQSADDERRIELNIQIDTFAEVFANVADHDCTVIIYGYGDLNLIAFLLSLACKTMEDNILTVDDSETRAICTLADKMDVRPDDIENVQIWGNPASLFYVDITKSIIENYNSAIWKSRDFKQQLTSVFVHWKWYKLEFKKEMLNRYEVKPNDASLPLVHRVLTVLEKWYQKSPDDNAKSMSIGVISDGLYGIPEGFALMCPVLINNRMWQPDPQFTELPHKDALLSECLEQQFGYVEDKVDSIKDGNVKSPH